MASRSRPRLTYVVNSLNPGGTERLVIEMSLGFADEYDVQVLCLDEAGAWADELRQRGIPVEALGRAPGIDLSMPRKIARLTRRHRANLIHAHQCTPWFYAALSRLLNPTPRLLFEEHGRFYPEVEGRARALVNRVVIRNLTHRFVAVSADIRSRLVRYEGLDANQIEVVYNGVAAPPLLSNEERTALRQGFGFTSEDFVVGTVGRFDPIKNLPMLVAALESARLRSPAIAGMLVGDGPVFADIKALVNGGPLRDRIHLTGQRQDAKRVVQGLDLFVLSSFSEGTSMALLEAMACGVPVVVTQVGGNPEVIVAGETGWTVPSGATEALADAIVEASADSGLRRRFALAGKRHFEERFGVARMLDEYRRRYRELAGVQDGHVTSANG